MAKRKKRAAKARLRKPSGGQRPAAPVKAVEESSATAGAPRTPTVFLHALPLLGVLMALVLAMTLGFLWNEDFWWYLESGEVILEEGKIPEHDPFLYTSSERTRWPSHSWLWTVVVALFHRGFGLAGVTVFGAAVAAAMTVLVFCSARVDRFGLVNAVLTALVLAAASERLSHKSELATWLLLAVFFYLLDRKAAFTWRTLLALTLLQWLWANLHAGYPLGIAVVLAYSAGGWLEGRWRRRRSGVSPAAIHRPPPLWAAPLLLLICFLTPRAAERLKMLGASTEISAAHLAGSDLSVTVSEMETTFGADDKSHAVLYLLALAAGGIGLVAGRSRPGFLSRALFVAGMAVIAYTATRHVTGLALAAALVTSSVLGELRSATRRERPATGFRRLHLPASVAFGLLILAAAAGVWRLRSDFEIGQSEDELFTINPLAACPSAASYVLEHDLPGPIFNDMSLGGYLTYRLYPRHQLFIDNRILANRRMREYLELSSSRERWLAAEQRYGFRTAVLSNLLVPSRVPLRSILANDPRWRLVYLDPMAAVFVRGDAAAPQQLRFAGTREVPFLAPESGPGGYLRAAARYFFPTRPSSLLDQYLSVLGKLRRFDKVEELSSGALELRPGDASLYRIRGSARMLARKSQDGIEDLREAIRQAPDDPWNHHVYALALRDTGKLREALAAAAEARRLDSENSTFEGLYRDLSTRLRR